MFPLETERLYPDLLVGSVDCKCSSPGELLCFGGDALFSDMALGSVRDTMLLGGIGGPDEGVVSEVLLVLRRVPLGWDLGPEIVEGIVKSGIVFCFVSCWWWPLAMRWVWLVAALPAVG